MRHAKNRITSLVHPVFGGGGVFIVIQNWEHNLRITTTEPFEYMFGTECSQRRGFMTNEFIIYSNKLEIAIMKNVVQNYIKSATSTKGYMTGFTGFAAANKILHLKLNKVLFTGDEINAAIRRCKLCAIHFWTDIIWSGWSYQENSRTINLMQ